ncbi:MAG: twin-arginine translocation signal domain-containing protein [Rhodospirillales bacterium]|nr:twin-arginine translocation signal domain-containing protein [Rhodospirillales bacterium]
MNRRAFLRTTAAGGAGLTANLACAPPGAEPPSDTGAQGEIPPFEFDEITADDLHRMMESGEHTARSITEAYLGRIEAMDRQGPELRSMIEINPDALEIADELDAERSAFATIASAGRPACRREPGLKTALITSPVGYADPIADDGDPSRSQTTGRRRPAADPRFDRVRRRIPYSRCSDPRTDPRTDEPRAHHLGTDPRANDSGRDPGSRRKRSP